jgi:hypothetical protein
MTRPLILALLLLGTSAFAQGPSARWRTLTTAHFRIHYPAEYEAWTLRAAAHIESVREAVVREVGFAPEAITDILVMNPIAAANGATLPLLDHPRIVLFTHPPEPESQVGEFSNWIDLLTVHEMAHLVHLLRPSRNPTQRFLAHLLPLNPIMLSAPRWMLEGYATVIEGRLTGSGRPSGSMRAAILRKWAVNGRLPSYSQLNSDRRFLGMSMAYLVGSAFLEWLEQRSSPDALRHLWARMTARQRRGFDQAFEGVFGELPARLYGRFVAELTERASTVARVEEASLREGELWQETTRGSGDPAVSPDGSKLALVQRNARGEAKLVVFSTGPNPEEEKLAKRIERMLKRDPQDVAPVRTKPLPRKPLHTLRPRDGGDITSPRWTRDGTSVLYTHKQPDDEGFLHHDLFLWTPESGRNRRLTHLAGVADADPLPDGKRAIAVRSRFGFSDLVTVDLSTGDVSPYGSARAERLISHPRVSSDGRIAWAEHDSSGWHVVLDGQPLIAPGAFSPEWGSEGALYCALASRGFIEIARIDRGVDVVTRTLGAAFRPAPAPDGSLYFMSLEPDGWVVRRLTNPQPLAALTFERSLVPALPPDPAHAIAFRTEQLPPARPYGFGRQEPAWTFGGAYTAYGNSNEFAFRLGDVIGRLDSLAMASTGSDSADRGAALAVAWRGWPVAITQHLFKLRNRRGVEIRSDYEFHGPLHVVTVEAGGLAGSSSRAFVDSSLTIRQLRSNQTLRVAIDSKQHARVSVRAAGRLGGIRLVANGEAARRMTIGGVASSIDPDALLLERVLDPALPLGFARAEHYRGWRGEVTLSGLTAFWQRHTGNLTVRGFQWTMHSPPIPLLRAPGVDVTAGVARVRGIRGTKAWLALRWRP